MAQRCDECGKLTSDGARGDAGSAHEHLWYCLSCWQSWDTAHAEAWEAAQSAAVGNGYTMCHPPLAETLAPSQQVSTSTSEAVSYGYPEGLPDSTSLEAAAQNLLSIADSNSRDVAIQTVFKIIDAIIATPEDAKKRQLKKANEAFNKKVGQHSSAMDFLRCVGFTDADDPATGNGSLLVMSVAFVRRLVDAHERLADVAVKNGISAPSLPNYFNPFQESIQSVGLAPTVRKKLTEDEIRERELRRLEKEKVEAGPPVDMNPSVFWLSAGRKLQDVIRETLEESGGSGTTVAEITPTINHKHCILRVIFPDKSVLQVHFRAADCGKHVMDHITPLLALQVQAAAWYLYTTPPLKRLGPADTLASAGLSPGANVYLGFDGERITGPYLEDGLLLNLGPPPA